MGAKTGDVWVFIESGENIQQICGIELLGIGRELAQKQGGLLVAVLLGNDNDVAINACGEHGADKVIVIEGSEYARCCRRYV